MNLSTLWSKVRQLTWREWTDLVRAEIALVLAQLSLLLRPRGQLLANECADRDALLLPIARQRAGELEWALSRALQYGVVRPKCLARSLALHRMLRAAGIPGSRIRLGVRPEGTGLTAHAWVTLNGAVLADDPEFVSRFTEITDARLAEVA